MVETMNYSGPVFHSATWNNYKTALKSEPRLGKLKAFRDQLLCDTAFAKSLREAPLDVLQAQYPMLRINDAAQFLPADIHTRIGWHGDSSDIASLLRQALDLDIQLRNLVKTSRPRQQEWHSWRERQIERYRREDPSTRAAQITHIPFAFELTEGCSGGCSFCGLSADPLSHNGEDSERSKQVFRNLLQQLHHYCGEFAQWGVLYWATDPLDYHKYELYADTFAEELGQWPSTTTALAETQIDRIKAILHSGAIERPWAVRCSMRSPSAYQQLVQKLTDHERALLRLLPQYKQSQSVMAMAGRAFDPDGAKHQLEVGGTIACMSGFLISLPRHEIQLITPCLAEPQNRNGYRVIATDTRENLDELLNSLNALMRYLPCPPLSIRTKLKVTIDDSQFSLYEHENLPNLLTELKIQPSTLLELSQKYGHLITGVELTNYCLALLQYGVVRAES